MPIQLSPSVMDPLQPAMQSSPAGYAPNPQQPQGERDYSLVDLWKILVRRRKVIFMTVGALVLLAAAYTLLTPRLYKAESSLQILKEDAAAGLADPAQAAASEASDALDFNLALQTQVDVMQSRNMALRVVQELHLDRTKDYQLKNDKEEDGLPLAQAPRRTAYILKTFAKRLKVDPVSGTRLVTVSFLDRDPKRAAQVVNQLLADFIEYNYQVRYEATKQATALMSKELDGMKTNVESAQANAAKLQEQSGIYGVDETNNSVNSKLDQLNTELTAAQANLSLKESIYNLAKTRSPEVLAGMLGSQGPGGNTANAPLQLLRQQQADAAANYAELNARYGPEYPKVVQANERLKSIQASIDSEINRLVGQATAEYRVAEQTEEAAAAALQHQQAVAAQMNHSANLYTTAKHEADSNRDLYEQMMRRLKEAGILAGLHSTKLNILDIAIVPDKPAQPRPLLYIGLALLLGLALGTVFAFTSEAMDTTVRDPLQIEESTSSPVLAMIPAVESILPQLVIRSLQRSTDDGTPWQYHTTSLAPRSNVAEAFRALRTSILTAMRSTRPAKVIAITSTAQSEGKSFTSFNLAAAFAQSGRTVLLVDADLRKRSLSKALDMQLEPGLHDALSSPTWLNLVKKLDHTPGLFLMPAGHDIYSPADLLGSPRVASLLAEMRESFDLVLLDTPSILPVTDTVSLSNAVDAVLVVVRSGVSGRESLVRTMAVLRRAGARILGVVLNGVDFKSTDFRNERQGYQVSAKEMLAPVTEISMVRPVIAILAMLLALGMSQRAANAQEAPAAKPPMVPIQLQATQPASPSAKTSSAAPQPLAPMGPASPRASTPTAQEQGQILIEPGDVVTIAVYDAPELSQDVRVTPSGTANLALLGDTQVKGLRPEQLARNIESELVSRKLIMHPHVSVSIKEFTTQGITIEGDVQKAGVYPVYSPRLLVDVIAMASGLSPTADTHITIRRTSGETETADLSQNNGKSLADNKVMVYPGDTVIVPRANFAYVVGEVARPGGYIMHDNGRMTVLQALSEAQGTTRTASAKKAVLLRRTPNGTVRIPINLHAILRGKAPDEPMQSEDILFIPSSLLKSFAQDTQGVVASVSGAALYTFAP
ncbi:MAG: polysaccharide biosynthesis tyrosine autokinase [Acidobacteriaceae bacterium]